MCETRFYRCPACETVIGMIHDGGSPIYCCGAEMERLDVHGADDPGAETHLPHASMDEYRIHITVGDQPHPMTAEHAIQWIYLQTDRGGQRKCLSGASHDKMKDDIETAGPTATFALADEHPRAVYAYCGRHGLWRKEL